MRVTIVTNINYLDCSEEWKWLVKKENLRESLSSASHQQRLFIEQIAVTARRLFTYMEVPHEEAANHR